MPWGVVDNSPTQIRALLARHGLALKKRWGQNFMISPDARAAVVASLGASSADRVWEIGPGLGAITAMLLDVTPHVTVFEIDWGLVDLITQRFGDAVRMVPGDAVDTIGENAGQPPDLIVGNLPYRSAAAIITTIFENSDVIGAVRKLSVTVQREMARRVVASPSTKDYSPFSVIAQITCRVKIVRDLGKGHFYPAPEVISSLVTFEPSGGDHAVRTLAARLSRALFSNRRKTIANNVGFAADALGIPAIVVHQALESAGFDERARAEVISPGQYVELASAILELAPELVETPG